MAFWAKAFRFTAMFLILYIGVDVLTCDVPSSECSVVSSIGKHPPTHQAPDNCICCCAHPLIVAQLTFVAPAVTVEASTDMLSAQPISRSQDIEHPPQLS